MSCDYCEGFKPIGFTSCDVSYTRGIELSLMIERHVVLSDGKPPKHGVSLVMNDFNGEDGFAAFDINYCPMCGSYLKEGAE